MTNKMKEEKEPKRLTCRAKRCIEANDGEPYEWNYRGNSKIYTSCPRCRALVKVYPVEK